MPGVPYLLYRKEFMKMSDNNNNAKTMYEAVPAAAELNKVPGLPLIHISEPTRRS